MSKATSVAALAAALIVNFALWWAIVTSAGWVVHAARSVVVTAIG
jgi:hypothetical protein